jgi:hypothetical protein
MGNSLPVPKLSVHDDCPLILADQQTVHQQLATIICLPLSLIDIIVSYRLSKKQYLITISGTYHGSSPSVWSPLSIGWIASSLPMRPSRTISVPDRARTSGVEVSAKLILSDIAGYRRIFGTFQDHLSVVLTSTILKDRLYLFGYTRNFRERLKIISCSIDDILVSAFSSSIPLPSLSSSSSSSSSKTGPRATPAATSGRDSFSLTTLTKEASLLIQWKSDHAPVMDGVWNGDNETVTAWRSKNRWVLVSCDEEIGAYRCFYYDIELDSWHTIANLPLTSIDSMIITEINNQLYAYSYDVGTTVWRYDDIHDQWMTVPTLQHPKRTFTHLIPWLSMSPSKGQAPSSPIMPSSMLHGTTNIEDIKRATNLDKADNNKNYCDSIMVMGLTQLGNYEAVNLYDIAGDRLMTSPIWPWPEWCSSRPASLYVINNEWLLWPSLHDTKKLCAMIPTRSINDPKQWRWYDPIPGNSRFLLVSSP